MEKVKLPKEVAEALDYHTGWSIHQLVESVVNMGTQTTKELYTIRKYFVKDWSVLVKSLANGYEVEETPEDKVRNYYNQQNSISTDDQDTSDRVIRNVLNMLEIYIKDVNA